MAAVHEVVAAHDSAKGDGDQGQQPGFSMPSVTAAHLQVTGGSAARPAPCIRARRCLSAVITCTQTPREKRAEAAVRVATRFVRVAAVRIVRLRCVVVFASFRKS